jgi:hypothetical protein
MLISRIVGGTSAVLSLVVATAALGQDVPAGLALVPKSELKGNTLAVPGVGFTADCPDATWRWLRSTRPAADSQGRPVALKTFVCEQPKTHGRLVIIVHPRESPGPLTQAEADKLAKDMSAGALNAGARIDAAKCVPAAPPPGGFRCNTTMAFKSGEKGYGHFHFLASAGKDFVLMFGTQSADDPPQLAAFARSVKAF